MAKKKFSKKAQKEAKELVKKYPLAMVIVAIVLIVCIGVCCFLHYKRVITIPFLVGIIPQEHEDIITDDLQIHFLEVGNQFTGDCTLIKVGDTEVLIDAGSIKGSAGTIVPYIQNYCTDGVLEYVIVTHAHQDHIAGFVGTNTAKGVFESFICGTIIDYARANTTSDIRYEYEALRDEEIAAGAKHYTAFECVEEQNGAKKTYTLADDITMTILDHKYYTTKASSDNDYSVCMLLSQGNNHYLFTGDLEEHGEASLVERNTLPQVKLFKAGHHGSKTSSNTVLLSVIQPEIVCVCCCAGTDEYTSTQANQFPTQDFINRVAPYTDKVYVTSGKPGYTMNGNIAVSCIDGKNVTVTGSNNNTILKDTEWFKAERTLPSAWMPY